jgi:hypothetical protein
MQYIYSTSSEQKKYMVRNAKWSFNQTEGWNEKIEKDGKQQT